MAICFDKNDNLYNNSCMKPCGSFLSFFLVQMLEFDTGNQHVQRNKNIQNRDSCLELRNRISLCYQRHRKLEKQILLVLHFVDVSYVFCVTLRKCILCFLC